MPNMMSLLLEAAAKFAAISHETEKVEEAIHQARLPDGMCRSQARDR
jgi:hypothetical protein